ncbi:hypothetical protein GEV33_005059 [Tenebrio molitor]|uniref:EF-hand domain-containing protein n=1 Tax=Tenebrio molitor TaxID=7067 RepID=A0A8J6LCX6_TENMO|nr:hypothetical protein GEV33_005059 [Tenebrio molitor]
MQPCTTALSIPRAKKFLKSSKSKSGDLSLADFIYYVREHEKNLRLHFSHLDRNKDGKIDLEELIRAFSDLGIPLDRMEAKKLLQRMDQDGSLNISYDEWRDFLLLAPNSQDIHQLIIYWRHSTTIGAISLRNGCAADLESSPILEICTGSRSQSQPDLRKFLERGDNNVQSSSG